MSLGISCINVTVDRDVVPTLEPGLCVPIAEEDWFQNSTNTLLVQDKEPHTSGLRAESSRPRTD